MHKHAHIGQFKHVGKTEVKEKPTQIHFQVYKILQLRIEILQPATTKNQKH